MPRRASIDASRELSGRDWCAGWTAVRGALRTEGLTQVVIRSSMRPRLLVSAVAAIPLAGLFQYAGQPSRMRRFLAKLVVLDNSCGPLAAATADPGVAVDGTAGIGPIENFLCQAGETCLAAEVAQL